MAAKKKRSAITFRFGAPGEILHQYVGDRNRVRIIIGPLGSAKTTTTIQHLLELIVSQKPNRSGERKSRWVAIRNTYPDLETTTIPDFREIFTEDLGTFKKTNPPRYEMDLELTDGTRVISEFLFLALDQPDDIRKLRGTQLTGGWLNEAKEIPPDVISMLDSRIGRFPSRRELGDYYHCIVGDTNAPDDEHWIAKAFNDPEDYPGWKVFRQPGAVLEVNGQYVINPHAENLNNLPKGYYDALVVGKRKDWIQVNVMNEFGTTRDGKPVHPDFSRDLHVANHKLEAKRGLTLIIGIDFGRTPAAVIYQKNGFQRQVLNELCTENTGALKFGRLLKDFLNKEYPDFEYRFWGDPSGDDMAQTRDESPIDVLGSVGIECYPAETNDFVIRQNALDSLLTQVTEGRPHILFSPVCKTVIRGLDSQYQFRRLKVRGMERYHEKPDKNMYSHPCEALHYGLMGEGEADGLIGFTDDDLDDIEQEEDFDGWHAAYTGV